MVQTYRLLGSLITIAALSGCATIHNHRSQLLPVATTPAGAAVSVQCGRAQPITAVTPTTVRVSRRAWPCAITLTKEGYGSRTISLDRKVSGWFWANLAWSPVLAGLGYAGGEDSCTGFFCSTRSDDARGFAILGVIPAGIGMGVDAATGAMYKREPARIEIELKP